MIEIEIIASRTCAQCGKTIKESLVEVNNLDENTTPWILYYTFLFELRKLTCCNSSEFPTYIQMKSQSLLDSNLFSDSDKYEIGSEDVPVICDDASSFAVTRTYQQQVEIEKQLKKQSNLWERQKEAFFKKIYTYFSTHFDQIIDEMDHREVLDVLRAFEDDYLQTSSNNQRRYVYRGKNVKKSINKSVKKEVKSLAKDETEEIKKYLFFLIVEYFVLFKLIPQINYLKWNVQKFEKMIGESLLMYLLVTFPLTSYFSFLKDEAILRLTYKGHFQKEIHQLLEKTQNQLKIVSKKNENLQRTVKSQREVIADMEEKTERLRIENSRLDDRLNETGDNHLQGRQGQKIKELKGIINELQEEIKELRKERIEKQTISEEIFAEKHGSESVTVKKVKEKDISRLSGVTVAIFGDIQCYSNENDRYPCSILTVESMNNPNAVAILNDSDVIVVLIQHIAHSCMWSIKEYANQRGVPVVYSRHTNLQLIMDQVLQAI